MAKTIKDILDTFGFDPTNPTKTPIYISEDSTTGAPLPYRIAQNGTEEIVEYMDFGADIIDTVKFLVPNAPWFRTLSKPEAFRDCDVATREEDTKQFSFEWTAMFDQLKSIPADVKDNGGMFVFPNVEYLKKRLDDITCKRETLTNVRREFSKMIRDCIAHNYAEVVRLNKNLDEPRQIKLPDRSKGFMRKVALEEGTVKKETKDYK